MTEDLTQKDYFAGTVGKNRRIWVDALKSGKFHQDTTKPGMLGDMEAGFCCLGVACHVLGLEYNPAEGVDQRLVKLLGLNDEEGAFAYDKNSLVFDEDFPDDEEIYDGELHEFYGQESLVSVNDNSHAGFKRIAEFIEKHPERVFEEVA